MSNNIHIAISGKSGCGNSTVSKLTAQALGFQMVNYTFHTIAEEKGIDFHEFCKMAEEDPKWDYMVDEKQVELAMKGSTVLGSRLAIWMLEEADLKVYLYASPQVRAQRVHQREQGDLQQKARENQARDIRDHERYKKLYNIDNNQYSFADLIINTDRWNPQQISRIIIAAIQDKLQA
ncbi:MAG: AAA family ATPase [Spirochaetaceae bacterium]|jgi:cytidylate kinase|nr:AAA family ATPase [Spirochaetaceae bacterium]